MKVRKYFAADMRSALEMVRTEQGSDVLILSNRQLDDGVELITADESVDETVLESLREQASSKPRSNAQTRPSVRKLGVKTSPRQRQTAIPPGGSVNQQNRATPARFSDGRDDSYRMHSEPNQSSAENLLWTNENTVQQMQLEMNRIKDLLEQQLSGLAWSDYGQKHPQRAKLLRTLSRIGVTPKIARGIVEQLPANPKMDKAWRHALTILTNQLSVLDDPIISGGGSVAICGPTGVGKTTLVCKLAASYAKLHGVEKVTIFSLDDQRLGAHQQLKVFARLSGIECVVLSADDDVAATLANHEKDHDRHLALLDTGGFAPDDIRFRESLARLSDIDIYFTVAATTDFASLNKVFSLSADISIRGCIVTKLDEAAQLGGVLSALISANVPLAYVTAGQSVPDDLEVAHAKQLVAQAVALGAIEGAPSSNYSIESAFAGTQKVQN